MNAFFFRSFYLHEKNPSVRESVKHYAVILSGKRIEELEGAIKQNQQRYKTLHRAIERAKNDNLDESQLRSLLKQVVEDTDYTVRIPRPPPSAEHDLSRPSPIEHAEKSPLDNDEMVVVKDAEDCAADTSDKMQTDEAEEKTVGSRSAESLANSSHPSSASLTNVEYSSSSTTLQKTGGSSGLPAASAAKKAFRNNILHLWQTIVNHKHGALFVGPVKKDDAPDYYRVVQRPMDLNTVKTRVREGLCNDTLEFERDIAQTFVNAIMFNPEDTLINAMAKEIMQMAVQEIAKFKSTEKLVAYRRNSMQSN